MKVDYYAPVMNETHPHTALFTALSSVIALAAGVGAWFVLSQGVATSPWLLIPIATLIVAIMQLYMLRASFTAGREAGIEAAQADGATRLPSPTVARQLLLREFAAAERGRKLSIVVFSFDNLARLIATKPADANRVLLGIGAIMKRRTRGMNLSARLEDGHTFVSVLGGVDEFGAEKFVAKVAKDLASLKSSGQPVTVRAGIAAYEPEMHSVDDLLAKAHASLVAPDADDEGLLIA